ncbi:MAG: hypothetical protein MRERC_3c127 [Mycoplasmataceae bacterium RC_NB112A]|nr:MAG: hypothetical protein MRERC_3c127 [Mycoplasmataceae bacterium RC_NB112A]
MLRKIFLQTSHSVKNILVEFYFLFTYLEKERKLKIESFL